MQINIMEFMGLYTPNSSCNETDRINLTFNTAKNIWPSLVKFAGLSTPPSIATTSESCCVDEIDHSRAESLSTLFNHYGSDKSSHHNYHYIYAKVLGNPENVNAIMEIGLGTNNVSVASNMGHNGRPGASVRAFRDYCQNAQIYGADVDRGILFEEERIATQFVDQTRPATIEELFNDKPQFDLIVDDGLHSPDANINVMNYALPKLKVGGYVIIEDIGIESKPFWDIVDRLIPPDYTSTMIETNNNFVYMVRRDG